MKILLLTSVYKDMALKEKDTSTNIVNSFVNEWVKQGHQVMVIHNSHCYPRIIHSIPTKIKKNLATRMGFYIADYEVVSKKEYISNGAIVYRIPIKKYMPHTSPNKKTIARQIDKIKGILQNNDFYPDVITGHWASPQMEIISKLKGMYKCKTAVVLHGIGYIDSDKFLAKQYLKGIDKLGCRSLSQANKTKEILKLDNMPFVCYSGVPDNYLKEYSLNIEKYNNIKIWRITFVGRLVAYKNVDVIIKALSLVKNVDWEFNIIGNGAERENLERLVNDLKLEAKIHFLGSISRNQVMEILKDTNIFAMVSTNEIFGLVYLEAMAASCITIASKYGGVDGIINDGLNGFLSKEKDTEELYEKLNYIFNSDKKNIIKIANNAYKTACDYSDSKVAVEYLKNIIE